MYMMGNQAAKRIANNGEWCVIICVTCADIALLEITTKSCDNTTYSKFRFHWFAPCECNVVSVCMWILFTNELMRYVYYMCMVTRELNKLCIKETEMNLSCTPRESSQIFLQRKKNISESSAHESRRLFIVASANPERLCTVFLMLDSST